MADEVGASMRFATVDVHKVDRHPGIDSGPGPTGSTDSEDQSIANGA
jgi:hypothetical protein